MWALVYRLACALVLVALCVGGHLESNIVDAGSELLFSHPQLLSVGLCIVPQTEKLALDGVLVRMEKRNTLLY